MTLQNIIQTKGLCFSYEKEHKEINNLNLNVPKGSIYGFLGPNGSGKTTTIRLLLGLLKSNRGSICLFEKLIETNRTTILSQVGALIENPSLYKHLSAFDNLRIAAQYQKIQNTKVRIEEVLTIVKLEHVKHKKVKTFSLGMKQRLGIAIAILSNPSLLILDEPTNGLDPKGIIEMRQLITSLNKNNGITIFISSHLLSEIEKLCTHVGIIDSGNLLFQGSIDKLKQEQNEKIVLEIETNNTIGLINAIDSLITSYTIIDDSLLQVSVNSKQIVPQIIKLASNLNKLNIYQIKINNDLENLFLNLTA